MPLASPAEATAACWTSSAARMTSTTWSRRAAGTGADGSTRSTWSRSVAAAWRRRHNDGSSAVGARSESAARTADTARSTERHSSLRTRVDDQDARSAAVAGVPARFHRLDAAASHTADGAR